MALQRSFCSVEKLAWALLLPLFMSCGESSSDRPGSGSGGGGKGSAASGTGGEGGAEGGGEAGEGNAGGSQGSGASGSGASGGSAGSASGDAGAGGGGTECPGGFTGEDCEECADGHFGEDCERCPKCLRGSCDQGLSGTGECECEDDWTGDLCEIPTFTGDGSDGDLVVSSAINLNAYNSNARTCADGGDAVHYSVVGLTSNSATLSSEVSAGCLVAGDEVLLINLQGTSSAFGNVGNWETLVVQSVSASTVTFSSAKTRFYGDASDDSNIGTASTQQRVMLQRVPNYDEVTILPSGTLNASEWNGQRGGVLFFRATSEVHVNGAIDLSAIGYLGGPQTILVSTHGTPGESISGLATPGITANQGGGAGGHTDEPGTGCDLGRPGGGAGHATDGVQGFTVNCGGGAPGGALGVAELTKLLLGSGGGSGAMDDSPVDNPPGGYGGRGGGIIAIFANSLMVSGAGRIDASASNGQGDVVTTICAAPPVDSPVDCWDYTGPGGGGAGGSILLQAGSVALGMERVRSLGGLGGEGASDVQQVGGDGSAGRIAVRSASPASGSSAPPAHLLP